MIINNKNKPGFTLMEVLITIGVVTILSAGVITAIGGAPRQNARNNRRKADLAAIQQALESYRNDKGYYPTSSATLSPSYIKNVPSDPKDSSAYPYAGIPAGCTLGACTGYTLRATLENPTTTYTVGPL